MSNLLGNQEIKQEMAAGNYAHAYLITGEEGMGKKTLARQFATQLIGDTKGAALRDEHPDVLWLYPSEKGKRFVPVDEVRDFRREAYILPNQSPKKVLIVPCDLLNESGQNAILKILEEPPAHAVFLLLATSREAVLPTVRSRCVIWEMQPVEEAEGVAFLQQRYPDGDRLSTLLRAAGGNLGKAMMYLEGGTLLSYGELGIRVLGKLCRNKRLEADQMLSQLPKGEFAAFLDSFARLCRDFLIYKTDSGQENIVFLESVLQIKAFLGRMRLAQIYKMAALTLDCKTALLENGNENLIKISFVAEMGELLS